MVAYSCKSKHLLPFVLKTLETIVGYLEGPEWGIRGREEWRQLIPWDETQQQLLPGPSNARL